MYAFTQFWKSSISEVTDIGTFHKHLSHCNLKLFWIEATKFRVYSINMKNTEPWKRSIYAQIHKNKQTGMKNFVQMYRKNTWTICSDENLNLNTQKCRNFQKTSVCVWRYFSEKTWKRMIEEEESDIYTHFEFGLDETTVWFDLKQILKKVRYRKLSISGNHHIECFQFKLLSPWNNTDFFKNFDI